MMEYFQIPASDLGKDSKIPILKLGDSGEVFYEMAMEMINCIQENQRAGKATAFICPVGPVGQYPIFVRLVNRLGLNLRDCWFFNMDEYLDDGKQYIDINSPLSFRGFMKREIYDKIDPFLVMPEQQRVFPDPNDPGRVAELIAQVGGVDIAFGGIGINGHLAFNEADPTLSPEAFAQLPTRVLEISRETRTANAIGDRSGAIDAMPRWCITIGMKDILAAKKVRLGVFRDWHRSVIRQAAYGPVTASFPASLLQHHPDAMIYTNANAAQQPF